MITFNFEKYLLKLFKEITGLSDIFDKIGGKNNLYIVGGSIRDAYYNEINDYSVRDIDLIIHEQNNELDSILKDYNYEKNRFGGYKISLEKIEVDIWTYNDNWAIKNKLVNETSIIRNIAKGALLNIDSLVYDYYNKKINDELFYKVLESKEIDFVTDNQDYINLNPNKELNIFRILYSKQKYELSLSQNIKKYIKEFTKEELNYLDIIYKSQFKHYQDEKLNKNQIYDEIQKQIYK